MDERYLHEGAQWTVKRKLSLIRRLFNSRTGCQEQRLFSRTRRKMKGGRDAITNLFLKKNNKTIVSVKMRRKIIVTSSE